MEPMSLVEIKELVARRKNHAEKLQKRLTTVFEELIHIEIEIRKIEGVQEGPFRDPNRGWRRESADDQRGSPGPDSSGPDGRRRELIDALEAADWNITEAARVLGVHRNTVLNRIKKWGIRRLGEVGGDAP